MKFALAAIIVTLVVASANSVSELRSKLPREAVLAPAELSMILGEYTEPDRQVSDVHKIHYPENVLFLLEIARQQMKRCEEQDKKCKNYLVSDMADSMPSDVHKIHYPEDVLFLLEIARQQRKRCEDQGKKVPCQ